MKNIVSFLKISYNLLEKKYLRKLNQNLLKSLIKKNVMRNYVCGVNYEQLGVDNILTTYKKSSIFLFVVYLHHFKN